MNTIQLGIAHFTRKDLSLVDLSGATLTGTDLTCANLTRANLSGAKLTNVNLSNTILCEAYLSNISINRPLPTFMVGRHFAYYYGGVYQNGLHKSYCS